MVVVGGRVDEGGFLASSAVGNGVVVVGGGGGWVRDRSVGCVLDKRWGRKGVIFVLILG